MMLAQYLRMPDEEQCRAFNADIMRTLISRKMAKQKTFYELKVIPQQPVIINNNQSPRLVANQAANGFLKQ